MWMSLWKRVVAWDHAAPVHHLFVPLQSCQSLTSPSLSLISKRQCLRERVPFPSVTIYLSFTKLTYSEIEEGCSVTDLHQSKPLQRPSFDQFSSIRSSQHWPHREQKAHPFLHVPLTILDSQHRWHDIISHAFQPLVKHIWERKQPLKCIGREAG